MQPFEKELLINILTGVTMKTQKKGIVFGYLVYRKRIEIKVKEI